METTKQRIERVYFYKNDKLLNKLQKKEDLVAKLNGLAHKCPHCKEGYYDWDNDDGDYGGHSWIWCYKCETAPTPYRQKMMDDTEWYPEFDHRLFDEIENYECPLRFNQELSSEEKWKKIRDFDPKGWEQINELSWDNLVEAEINDYIKYLDGIIKKAKKYPLLRRLIK